MSTRTKNGVLILIRTPCTKSDSTVFDTTSLDFTVQQPYKLSLLGRENISALYFTTLGRTEPYDT